MFRSRLVITASRLNRAHFNLPTGRGMCAAPSVHTPVSTSRSFIIPAFPKDISRSKTTAMTPSKAPQDWPWPAKKPVTLMTRHVELTTRDNHHVSCTIIFKEQLKYQSSWHELDMPIDVLIEYVNKCRTFWRERTLRDIMMAKEIKGLPSSTCTSPNVIEGRLSIAIDDAANTRWLPGKHLCSRVVRITQPNFCYDMTLHSAHGRFFSMRLYVTGCPDQETRDLIVDDLVNKYTVFFWTKKLEDIVYEHERNLIPKMPIDSKYDDGLVNYQFDLMHQVTLFTQTVRSPDAPNS